eukprot:CAMPEP_0174350248 /NCGR_PEP_ID=MMETSP0811_2-20130205/7276_1 /TAXON_ID=73025 ORGANISM="Eutreptiella gymnastica-like, Strain CCMP1594" /NCGR_SAMPLE_ID=MMETSP0811_2 /ASSEMBLY_ACC=CAM_ASM_000667 /LENGTH=84 /DNA_ID=CAMNT_0015478379 /DNA_START=467 /DNA_END=718 /DNA_ORIENTATION=+
MGSQHVTCCSQENDGQTALRLDKALLVGWGVRGDRVGPGGIWATQVAAWAKTDDGHPSSGSHRSTSSGNAAKSQGVAWTKATGG